MTQSKHFQTLDQLLEDHSRLLSQLNQGQVTEETVASYYDTLETLEFFGLNIEKFRPREREGYISLSIMLRRSATSRDGYSVRLGKEPTEKKLDLKMQI